MNDDATQSRPADIYEIPITQLDGSTTTLDAYRGQVLLIVNVASQCAYTSQYAGLEELYQKYRDRGLVVLGFPCNQFLWQEPGSIANIQACTLKYRVTFPVFAKLRVNGFHAHPLYQRLTSARRGILGTRFIKWNFTKFLVDRNGQVVARFSALSKPSALEQQIEQLLG